ncbi:MAG TPA: tetratricopeptide repeat protein, partial [Planctomycetota bacterium]|nr:tetratricopeptide repeat protein [Planctomycetota bacterium]
APPEEGEIEARLLEAQETALHGDLKTALALAGEAVRLAPERPDGYLALGDLNLRFGDLLEARRSYEAAERKAGSSRAVALEALAGRGRVAHAAGDFDGAARLFDRALGADPTDPFGVRPPLAEVRLLLGDAPAALAAAAPADDALPDEHLVASWAARRAGDPVEAIARARLALFGNLYLLAAILDEPAPELGLVHGVEEATPDYAREVAERLRPIVDADPEAADFLARVASSRTTAEEAGAFVAAARALLGEPDPARRAAHVATLNRLRDPERVRRTSAAVFAEIESDDAAAGAGDSGACGFDV